MYTRVTTLPVQPGKLDELVSLFAQAIVPVLHALPGFHELLLLTDPSTEKALSISIWHTEAEWAASEKIGVFQQQAAKLAGILAGPPLRESYRLRIQI